MVKILHNLVNLSKNLNMHSYVLLKNAKNQPLLIVNSSKPRNSGSYSFPFQTLGLLPSCLKLEI